MRIDHYAYQQATRVAGFGLLLQIMIGLTLLIFGRISHDTTFQYAAYYVLTGILVWVALIVIFQQHKLERLEALEADELAALRGSGTSVFESEGEDLKVASRRLRLMHKWLMPIVSVLVAGLLVLFGSLVLRDFRLAGDVTTDIPLFSITSVPGWGVALCLFLAAIGFIFSRFVAGMAKQAAWQNLRGGAGYMVGNALVMFGIAVGIIFVFFDRAWVMEYVARGIAFFMFVVAFEIGLNLVLNLYRPRRPGETPRPAFDSRLLSLFAAPDSIVRTINEAVNYQFGFDITSSWGYQLLMRSFAWLAFFAAVILIGLNMIVIVEPGQEAVRIRGGSIVDQTPLTSGLHFKLPWPFESATIESVDRIRELPLGAQSLNRDARVNLWDDPLKTDIEMKPFMVLSSRRTDGTKPDAGADYSLVLAELIMYWRIRPGQLIEFMSFSDDHPVRRSKLNMREQLLQSVAVRETGNYFKSAVLDEVLAQSGASLGVELQARIQSAFDAMNAGVDVVAVAVPMLKPPQEKIKAFDDFPVEVQGRRQKIVVATSQADQTLVSVAGSVDQAQVIVKEITEYRGLVEQKADESVLAEKIVKIEQLIIDGKAEAASIIAQARSERWQRNMAALERSRQVLGDLEAYQIAPALYRERKIMGVLKRVLVRVHAKFLLGIDPRKVNFDFDVQQPDTGLNITENLIEQNADKDSSQ